MNYKIILSLCLVAFGLNAQDAPEQNTFADQVHEIMRSYGELRFGQGTYSLGQVLQGFIQSNTELAHKNISLERTNQALQQRHNALENQIADLTEHYEAEKEEITLQIAAFRNIKNQIVFGQQQLVQTFSELQQQRTMRMQHAHQMSTMARKAEENAYLKDHIKRLVVMRNKIANAIGMDTPEALTCSPATATSSMSDDGTIDDIPALGSFSDNDLSDDDFESAIVSQDAARLLLNFSSEPRTDISTNSSATNETYQDEGTTLDASSELSSEDSFDVSDFSDSTDNSDDSSFSLSDESDLSDGTGEASPSLQSQPITSKEWNSQYFKIYNVLRTKQYKTAINIAEGLYNRAQKCNQKRYQGQAAFQLAKAYDALNRVEQAIKYYHETRRMSPSARNRCTSLKRLKELQGSVSDAPSSRAEQPAQSRKRPRNGIAASSAATLKHNLSDFKTESEQLGRNNWSQIRFQLTSLIGKKQYDLALNLAHQALVFAQEKQPGYLYKAQYQLARIYDAQGNHEQSKVLYQTVLDNTRGKPGFNHIVNNSEKKLQEYAHKRQRTV